jgi:hypothetical protein
LDHICGKISLIVIHHIPLDLEDKALKMATKKRTRMKDYAGTWKITEMDQWDLDYVDMESPGCVVINKNGQGNIHFGAVEVWIDCRIEPSEAGDRLGFSFEGNDECDPVSGRGWALADAEEMTGHIFFHLGDDSRFKAKRKKSLAT